MKIKGIAKTRKVFLNGIELSPKKSQGYLNLSPGGFGWGDADPASAQLALAILLEHYSVPIAAIEEYEEFSQRHIATLKKGTDFDIEIHAWKQQSLN